MAAVRAASERCYAYFGRLLDERAVRAEPDRPATGGSTASPGSSGTEPGDDLIGWLMAAEVEGERLTRENILDISYLLILAGLDTFASSLACMIARLARLPELRRRLVAEPDLFAGAVEELLRFESPVQTGFRTATTDVEIAGEVIAAGTTFFLCWSSANLDPAAFPDPLAIDVARRPNPHIAFGNGFHRCLGIHLARMELRTALDQLHRRIPDYALKPGHELVFSGKPRTVNGLPLVWA
ncbi:MAG: cytochrome P450 [Myxococcales bacterium]|nr:cytochrome P450 [Myxococcales bacterium]